jgi:hypothetical protein
VPPSRSGPQPSDLDRRRKRPKPESDAPPEIAPQCGEPIDKPSERLAEAHDNGSALDRFRLKRLQAVEFLAGHLHQSFRGFMLLPYHDA